MPGEPLDFFYGADDGVAPGLLVAVATSLDGLGAGHAARINVIDCGLSPRARAALERLLREHPRRPQWRIVPLRADDVAKFSHHGGGYVNGRFRPGVFARLLIPHYFPEAQFGIYLDSDIIVRRDLGELAPLREEPDPLFAVHDRVIVRLAGDPGPERCREYGLDPAENYFNSGFMVLNLHRWDRADFSAAVERTAAGAKFLFEDQTILNLVFAGRWRPIDEAWNWFLMPTDWQYLRPPPGCNWHCYGANKPWSFGRRFSPGVAGEFHRLLAGCTDYQVEPRPKKPYALWFVKNVVAREGFRRRRWGRGIDAPPTRAVSTS